MTIFWHILISNVLPLCFMIAIGATMKRVFQLDIKTLSKLNFYVFSPGLMFHMLYTTEISASMFGNVLLFFALFMIVQFGIIEAVVRARGHEPGMRSAMRNSVLFYNSANYGIPINQLAFAGNPLTLSVQIIIMMMQSLVPNTYGIYNVNAHKADWRQIAAIVLKMPTIYVIPLALLLHGFSVPLPSFVETPIAYTSDAFIGTALLTLGAQIGAMKWSFDRSSALDVGLSTVLRLLAGPLIAWGITAALGMDELISAALIVSSAVPTSLSSVLLAVEFDNEADFASRTVLVSTMASIFTMTAVIALLGI